mmetsp:Transcript_66/g.233  ORF Transcript_66/g.233 Transcript_66/m.233 type:complete len:214 (-) Transcript_66:202-843(-)
MLDEHRCNSREAAADGHMQRGFSTLGVDVQAGAELDQKPHGMHVAARDRLVQRRLAVLVLDGNVCTVLDEKLHKRPKLAGLAVGLPEEVVNGRGPRVRHRAGVNLAVDDQRARNLQPALAGTRTAAVKCVPAVLVTHVGVGTEGEQGLYEAYMALVRRNLECCLARGVLRVDASRLERSEHRRDIVDGTAVVNGHAGSAPPLERHIEGTRALP